MSRLKKPRYGRCLEDFRPGDVYAHPWDVTVDTGLMAFAAASFQCAMPVYQSLTYAQALGFAERPVHPVILLNLGLSFSVHDVSEQAIAHLAYVDVRFPEACHPGDTVTATSRVLDVKPASKGDRGVVSVRTVLTNQHGAVVCRFDRKALVRAGTVAERPALPWPAAPQREDEAGHRLPAALRHGVRPAVRQAGFAGHFEDFAVGDVFAHQVGKTVGDTEHMQLTQLFRNSHPIHFDEIYCRDHSFAKARVVYGGLVLSWVLALTSRDVAGNALWELGLDEGAHPNGTVAGDTLYASTRVLATQDHDAESGILTLRVVGTKNSPGDAFDPEALFTPELTKTEGKLPAKVVEITRRVLVRKAPH